MKTGLIILLLAVSAGAHAQSLKEALFGGKLKTQPGSVIRKGDDLSTKMDTTQNAAFNAVITDSAQALVVTIDSLGRRDTTLAVTAAPALLENTGAPSAVTWKSFVDSVASGVKTDMSESKKVKRGDYSVTITYTIETDGETTINDVFVAPDNDFVKQQVRSRLVADAPKQTPVLNSAGAPRKVLKRQTFVVSKSE